MTLDDLADRARALEPQALREVDVADARGVALVEAREALAIDGRSAS